MMIVAFVAAVFACRHALQTWRNARSRGIGHSDVAIEIDSVGNTLVFNANGTGGSDLYLMDLKTSEVTRVTDTAAYEHDASFSPNGGTIVFSAGVPGDPADHIFTCALDGSNRKQLTSEDADDSTPRFSPDGALIVFARGREYLWGGLGGNGWRDHAIYLMGRDGQDVRQVSPNGTSVHGPRFSSNGEKLICWHNGVTTMPVDGSEQMSQLINRRRAIPSPDNSLFAYSKGQFSPDHEIYVCQADGTGERQITQTSNMGCKHPVFTPDGSRLMFLREEWPNGPMGVPKFSLWEIDVSGENLRMIADHSLFDDPLAWNP